MHLAVMQMGIKEKLEKVAHPLLNSSVTASFPKSPWRCVKKTVGLFHPPGREMQADKG